MSYVAYINRRGHLADLMEKSVKSLERNTWLRDGLNMFLEHAAFSIQYTAHCSVEHNTTHSYDVGDVRTISTSMPTETSKEQGSCTFDFPSLANGPSNVPVAPPLNGVPPILTADPE
jgi:hypothetical protein